MGARYDVENQRLVFDNATRGEVEEYVDQIISYIREYAKDSGGNLDLSDYIGFYSKQGKTFVGDDYAQHKKNYDAYLENTAIVSYTEEYAAILDAQDKYKNALIKGDDKVTRETFDAMKASVQAAADKASADGNTVMADYFNGLMDAYQEAQNQYDFEDAWNSDKFIKGWTAGLKTTITEALKNLDGMDINEFLQLGEANLLTGEQASSYAILSSAANEYGMEVKDLINLLGQLGAIKLPNPLDDSGISTTIKSYGDLSESTTKIQDIMSQSSEIFQDNIVLSDEMGVSLKALIGDQEDWADAVDTSNGYVVKNASLLRKLVSQQKSAQKAIINTSKAQAQLQYQKTIKQIKQAIDAMQKEVTANGLVSDATLKTIDVLRSQLTTLKETIQQYALLEVSLTNAANAYSEYEAAKERDSRLSYDESFLEALKSIDEGILSGKVGTEEFEYAVKLLVPEDVYKAKQEISDIDGMVRAIHDYCDANPLFANWFTVDEDSGDLSITTDNIRAFINDAIEAGALVGDEGNFQIADGIEGIEQFTAAINEAADGAGVTEGAVLAMLSAMEDYDGTWGNILTDLQTTSIDRGINEATNALDDALKAQEDFIKSGGDLGSDKWKELCSAVEEANKALAAANNYAIKNVEFQNAADALKKEYTGQTKLEESEAKSYVETLLNKYNTDHGTTISTTIGINADGSIKYTEEQLAALQAIWQWYLEHPTSQMDVQLAVNRKQEDMELLDKIMNGGWDSLTEDEQKQIELDVSINKDSADQEIQEVKEKLQKDLDDYEANWGITPTTEDEEGIIEKLTIWEAKGLTFKINVDTTGVKEDLIEAGLLPSDGDSGTSGSENTINAKASRATNSSQFTSSPVITMGNQEIGTGEIKVTPNFKIEKEAATKQKEEIQKQLNAELTKSSIDLNAPVSFDTDPLANIDVSKVNELTAAYNKAAAAEQVFGNVDINNQLSQKATELKTLTDELATLKANGASENDIIAKTGEINTVISDIDILLQEKEKLGVPTEVAIQLVQNDIQSQMNALSEQLSDYGIDVTANITDYTMIDPDTGEMSISVPATVNMDPTALTTLQEYVNLVNQNNQIEVYTQDGEENVANLKGVVEEAQNKIQEKPIMNINNQPAVSAMQEVLNKINTFLSKDGSSITVGVNYTSNGTGATLGAIKVNGTAHSYGTSHVTGTANSSGNWGLKRDEKGSLVGELGTELVCRDGRYFTVGDSGAEFVNLKRGDIVFNHLQTKSLLEHGYVTSRGKMLAGGTAHAAGTAHLEGPAHYGIVSYSPSSESTSWKNGTASKAWESITNSASSLSDAADSLSSTSDEIEDETESVIDFIEYKLENIENVITKTTSKLETFLDDTSQISQKNDAYDAIIEAEKSKAETYFKAIDVYEKKAAELLAEIPDEFKGLAQNGGLIISDFIGEEEGKIVTAIEEYREWAQKATDAEASYYDTIIEIASKSVEKQQEVAKDYENVIGLKDRHSDLIQGQMDLLEEKGERLSENFYKNLINTTNDKIGVLEEERAALQKVLDDAVTSGNVEKGDDDWYEMVNAIYDVDDAIIECNIDLEEFQNAINDLYWDNLDKLIDRLDGVQNEIESLYDIVSDDDKVVDEFGNWTSEGIAALGLLAQQMETAKFKVQQYGEAISQLEKDYKNGLYSADEYNEKLAELKEAQWDEIKTQEQAKKSIIELNKARIEAVKDGIQKEIDAYSELIDKKKTELQLSKDAHDFATQVAEKQKDIADIQKKLAAMAGDNSASANAEKKKLQEELYNAQAELEELYYEHSIEKQQDALDDSLENFQNEKEDEMDALDEYLKDEERVISDSYETIKANTEQVVGVLTDIANEYGISLSDAVINPWKEGVNAIGTYEDALNTASSVFTDYLEGIKQGLLDLQRVADETATKIINATSQKEQQTTSAEYEEPKAPETPATPAEPSTPTVGQSVTVKKTATNFTRDGGNGTRMQSWVPGYTFTVMQIDGSEVLIGLNGQVTGWVDKKDLEGFAKGSKRINKDQIAIVDELGDELQLIPNNQGRLSYIKKGTGIIPADLTERLMKWGQLDPSSFLKDSVPSMNVPNVTTNEFNINMSFGELLHVDSVSQDTLPNLQKLVRSEFDNCIKSLNNSLKRFAR